MKYDKKTVTILDKDWIENDVNASVAKYKICGDCSCGKQFCKIPTKSNMDTWFMCPYCSAKYNSQKFGYAEQIRQRHIEQYGSIEQYKSHLRDATHKTKIRKYGSLEVANKIREQKVKQTNLAHFGCEYSFQSDIVKDKIKQTVSERYNNGVPVENTSQIKSIREKVKQTNMERYGVSEYLASEDVKKKRVETSKRKYNTDNPNSSDIVKQHKVDSVLAKYGVTNVNKIPAVRDKIHQTCIERYGKYWNVYKYVYDGIKFDSSWELIFYIWLRDHNRNFIYHPPISYQYINETGQSSVYEPDFIIDDALYEIKGDHFFNSDGQLINPYKKGKPLCLAKQRCMEEHKVTILKMVDLQDAFCYIDSMQLDISQFRIKGTKHGK